MGIKPSTEIRASHLDLATPLLEFFENSKEIMLILIQKYGLGLKQVGEIIKEDPEIIAADHTTLQATLHRAPSLPLDMQQFFMQKEEDNTYIFLIPSNG